MTKYLGAFVVCVAFVLSACGGGIVSPTPVPSEPTTTPWSLLTPASGSLTWERTGGIAGLCQQLVIQADGSYELEDLCRFTPSQAGQLTQAQAAQLQSWLAAYRSFTWSTPDQPGTADMFQIKMQFHGTGDASAPDAIQSTIVQTVSQWASSLMAPAATVPVPESGQGIEGKATLGPSCPVARAGDPCPDKPYQATIEVVDSQGSLVTRFQTDANGSFHISLPAGTYTLQGVSSGPFPLPPTVQVIVRSGQFTQITLAFDSGIR